MKEDKYYNKEEEKKVIDKGCITPLFIIAALIVLSFVVSESISSKKSETIKKEFYKNEDTQSIVYTKKNNTYDKVRESILNFCQEVNKSLPIKIDEYTTIESMVLIGNIITIKYRINVDDDFKEMIDDDFINSQKSDVEKSLVVLIDEFKTYTKDLVNSNYKFLYLYYSRSGNLLMQFAINPKNLNLK